MIFFGIMVVFEIYGGFSDLWWCWGFMVSFWGFMVVWGFMVGFQDLWCFEDLR